MLKHINWSQVLTIVVASVIVALMSKYLWKTKANADGTTSKYIGHDAIGTF